jgi:hypothetical protein
MYDMCTIYKNIQYVPDMYIKSVCFSAFILHISGTDRCKIGVRYLIFRPVLYKIKLKNLKLIIFFFFAVHL